MADRSKSKSKASTGKAAGKKGLKALAPRAAGAVQGGKRTTVRDANDKYANQ